MDNTVKTFNFTLVISGADEDTANLEDILYEAGCDDSLIYFRNGVTYLEFDREAVTINDALASAIKQVESTKCGLSVVRIEPDDLVTASEVARRTKKSREAIRKMFESNMHNKDFPHPVLVLNERSTLWSWVSLLEWFQMNNKFYDKSTTDKAKIISFTNKVIDLRGINESYNDIYKVICSKKSKTRTHKTLATSILRQKSSDFKFPTGINLKDINAARKIPRWSQAHC